MKISLPLALVFLLSTAVAAQTPPPVVTSIVPDAGPSTGGTLVVITGAHFALPPDFACILPCPGTVLFGGVEVVPQQLTDTRIDVKTPAHSAGLVDVTVKSGDGRSLTVADAFRYTTSAEAAYQVILLPIYSNGVVPGANGSRWQTDLWLHNEGPGEVTLAPWVCPDGGTCPAVFPLTYVVRPGETLHGLPEPFTVPGTSPGRLLYATRERAGQLSANLRTFDSSRLTTNAGTEVPIVREKDLHTSTMQLHNVPLDSHFRVMLRVYELTLDQSRFRVNFYPEEAGTSSQPAITSIDLTATSSESGPFRFRPVWGQYGAITDLLDQPTILPVRLRAEIVPLTPGSRFWAFISLTNNDTQHVTLITP